MGKLYVKKRIPVSVREVTDSMEVVRTLEGALIAKRGDYIITGPGGEEWPIKKGIFKSTYEEYEEE